MSSISVGRLITPNMCLKAGLVGPEKVNYSILSMLDREWRGFVGKGLMQPCTLSTSWHLSPMLWGWVGNVVAKLTSFSFFHEGVRDQETRHSHTTARGHRASHLAEGALVAVKWLGNWTHIPIRKSEMNRTLLCPYQAWSDYGWGVRAHCIRITSYTLMFCMLIFNIFAHQSVPLLHWCMDLVILHLTDFSSFKTAQFSLLQKNSWNLPKTSHKFKITAHNPRIIESSQKNNFIVFVKNVSRCLGLVQDSQIIEPFLTMTQAWIQASTTFPDVEGICGEAETGVQFSIGWSPCH